MNLPPVIPRKKPPPLPPPVIQLSRALTGWRYFSPEELRSFKNLLFTARAIVEGAYAGRHKSPFKGSSPEFTDYREYSPGDDLRMIEADLRNQYRLVYRPPELKHDGSFHRIVLKTPERVDSIVIRSGYYAPFR